MTRSVSQSIIPPAYHGRGDPRCASNHTTTHNQIKFKNSPISFTTNANRCPFPSPSPSSNPSPTTENGCHVSGKPLRTRSAASAPAAAHGWTLTGRAVMASGSATGLAVWAPISLARAAGLAGEAPMSCSERGRVGRERR